MPILLFLIAVLGVIFLAVSRPDKEGEGEGGSVLFYSRAKKTGFSFREIEMLRKLTVQCAIEPPHVIFESKAQFDKCIHSIIRGVKMSGQNEDKVTRDLIAKMYEYRQKIETSRDHAHNRISHPSQISEGQSLRILVEGTGTFNSRVIKNAGQYMTISRPENSKMTSTMSWTGLKISVFFWREEDAGYVFNSEVLDEVYSLGFSSLKISNSESLFRTQKRKSVRTKINKTAYLYLVPFNEPPHKLEAKPGLKCLLDDLSDTGCAVIVGGKAREDIRVKIQFALDNIPVCISGTVRSASYMEDVDRTILRIETDPMPMKLRNHILSEVFGMLPDDDEDELPFRILDDEMAAFASGGDYPGNDQADGLNAGGNPYADTGGQVSVDVTFAKPREINEG